MAAVTSYENDLHICSLQYAPIKKQQLKSLFEIAAAAYSEELNMHMTTANLLNSVMLTKVITRVRGCCSIACVTVAYSLKVLLHVTIFRATLSRKK